MWETVQSFIEKDHLNKVAAVQAVNPNETLEVAELQKPAFYKVHHSDAHKCFRTENFPSTI